MALGLGWALDRLDELTAGRLGGALAVGNSLLNTSGPTLLIPFRFQHAVFKCKANWAHAAEKYRQNAACLRS